MWQARRDSNPQHPVLETGALPVRATGLYPNNNRFVLLCFFMWSMLATKTAILAEFKFTRSRFFVFSCGVVSLFALCATKGDDVSHKCASFCMNSADSDRCQGCICSSKFVFYSIIEATTPAPTVRPPSRIAKRRPSSIAIGVISLMVMATLSPGITISMPAGSSATPVTSVVRK